MPVAFELRLKYEVNFGNRGWRGTIPDWGKWAAKVKKKKKKEEQGKRYLRNGQETIILLPNKYPWVPTVCCTIGMQQWSWGTRHESTKSEGAQSRPGLGGHIQSFRLRAIGKLPLKFFQAGESHVEICTVPRSLAAEYVFHGLEGNQNSTSQSKLGGGLCKQSGKETMMSLD